jgi:hypothetical protein
VEYGVLKIISVEVIDHFPKKNFYDYNNSVNPQLVTQSVNKSMNLLRQKFSKKIPIEFYKLESTHQIGSTNREHPECYEGISIKINENSTKKLYFERKGNFFVSKHS